MIDNLFSGCGGLGTEDLAIALRSLAVLIMTRDTYIDIPGSY